MNNVEESETKVVNPKQKYFKIHRFALLICGFLAIVTVYFHRTSPAVIGQNIKIAFNITDSQVSLVSSLFFWSTAVIQPLAAPFNDHFDPFLLLTIISTIASIGAVISGAAKTFSLLLFGRVLTGIGVGSIYLSLSRFGLAWFSFDLFPIIAGICLASGGIGSFISTTPLEYIAEKLSWRWAFYLSSIYGFVLSIIMFLIGKGDPTQFGYDPVPGAKPPAQNTDSFISKIKGLGPSFLKVIKIKKFWLLNAVSFFITGSLLQIQSFWCGPYLRDVLHFSDRRRASILSSLTIGQIASSILTPFISKKVNNVFYPVHVAILISMYLALFIMVIGSDFNSVSIYVFLILLAFCGIAPSPIIFGFVPKIVPEDCSATGLGFYNVWAFVGSAIFQTITSGLMNLKYSSEEMKYGWSIWFPTVIYFIMGGCAFIYFQIISEIQQEKNETDQFNQDLIPDNSTEN